MKNLLVLIAAGLLLPSAYAANGILLASIEGPITAADVELVREAISLAEKERMQAIIFTLNTPGGGLQETLDILTAFDETAVPIVVYVHPRTASAWSAGTFILISADIAAMTPYSTIGSSQPVSIGSGGAEYINESKIINAIVKKFEESARMHDRNTSLVRRFVVENLNLNSEEAEQAGAIEIVADDMSDLLKKLDGKEVKGKRLETAFAEKTDFRPSPKIGLLEIISDPMISGLLLIIGIYAVIFGLSSPGVGAEIAGVLLILLGLLGVGFDVNLAALGLFVFGVVLLFAELATPGFGVLGIAGLASIAVGSILLIPVSSGDYFVSKEFHQQAIIAALIPTAIMTVFFAFAFYKVLEVRRKKPFFSGMEGKDARAAEGFGRKKEGFVIFDGEYWKARGKGYIRKGQMLTVVGKEGHVLIVEPKKEAGKKKA
ncbi:MAG: nodulation protein NfeD [Candidatus Aenigmarchaeota archaeon]|nr:nodulation protein NfeD [Candidatus Aenigmarchaeota archaeon]